MDEKYGDQLKLWPIEFIENVLHLNVWFDFASNSIYFCLPEGDL